MDIYPASNKWIYIARVIFQRTWGWLVDYFRLRLSFEDMWKKWTDDGFVFSYPRYINQPLRKIDFINFLDERVDPFYSYFGICFGCLIAAMALNSRLAQILSSLSFYLFLGLAILLYPVVHRLGKFGDLHAKAGCLMLTVMYGFIFPIVLSVWIPL